MQHETTKHPILFSDQQRPDTMGCYGQKLPVTPNLDQLAKEGALFSNAYTCQPVCGPARACLQTGLYATQTGCYRNDEPLPLDADTIAKRFSAAGYETAYVGKWHLASGRRHGVDYQTTAIPVERRGGYRGYWVASDLLEFTSHGYNGTVYGMENERLDFIGYRADCITDYAIHYLRKKQSEKPFFLMVSYIEPHHQNDHNCYEGPIGSKQKFADYEPPLDLACRERAGDWRENYPDYLGQCHSLDYNLGRFVDVLKAQGIYDDTVIIYASDHGSHFRTRDGEYKRQCFDSCLHVPLIIKGIKGGEFVGGKVLDDMVSLINLPSTLMWFAGLSSIGCPEELPLQDLWNHPKDWQKEVFFQISEQEVSRGIRTNRYKYTITAPDKTPKVYREPGKYSDEFLNSLSAVEREEYLFSEFADSTVYEEQYLFDLEKDPTESKNLIEDASYQPVKQQLREALLRRMAQAGEQAPVIIHKGE